MSDSPARSAPQTAALASRVRPSLVLDERVARELLREAERLDVSSGGRFSGGPAGVQVWSGPWDAAGGTKHGTSVHLGSVDWTYDTPAKNYATIYRSMVTQAGLDRGETTESVLRAVLALAELSVEGPRIEQPLPPKRDPFKGSGGAAQ
ncbi:MAG TPA: hypothetical protein VNB94_08160 [Mycobacteriales bacterium]|nr:hypothetical protein [Mycobacteriales bacterium]